MGRRKNRSRSKISQLPPEIRNTVDAMVQDPADFTYNDIREYLASLDIKISKSAIGTCLLYTSGRPRGRIPEYTRSEDLVQQPGAA